MLKTEHIFSARAHVSDWPCVDRATDRHDLRLVRRFVRASARAHRVDRLEALLVDAAQRLGFRFVALAHHGDLAAPGAAPLKITNYPPDWENRFVAEQLFRHDPVQRAARKTIMGFRWSRLRDLVVITPRQQAVLRASRSHGLGEGFTVPLHFPGERAASCSFVVERGALLPAGQLLAAQLLGQAAFETARRLLGGPARCHQNLSPRQRTCVALMAAGLTDRGIAGRLGLSEETVTKYLNAARRRYGLARRTQLVAAALRCGEIGFDEIEPARSP